MAAQNDTFESPHKLTSKEETKPKAVETAIGTVVAKEEKDRKDKEKEEKEEKDEKDEEEEKNEEEEEKNEEEEGELITWEELRDVVVIERWTEESDWSGAVVRTKEEEYVLNEGVCRLFAAAINCGASVTWKFSEAPLQIQSMAHQGGDEDYVAFIPNDVSVPSSFTCSHFGSCSVHKLDLLRHDNRERLGRFRVGTH